MFWMQVRRDQGDIPVLRSITNAMGAGLWFSCILVLTHAGAAPPDGTNGPMQYDTYVNQRTHALQQTIRWARLPPGDELIRLISLGTA